MSFVWYVAQRILQLFKFPSREAVLASFVNTYLRYRLSDEEYKEYCWN